jgi:hypothetical protein
MLNFYLINLNLPLDLGSEILAQVASEYRIDPSILVAQVDRLENNYHVHDIKQLTLKKTNKFKRNGEKWGRYLGFRNALEYLSDFKDYREIMMINKSIYKII